MTDDEGVLGNLPRSRPGKRSEKRDPGKAAAKAPRASKKAAGAKATAKPRRAATPKPRAKAAAKPDPVRRQPADPAPETSGDAVASVVRTAATVAATGVRVAGALTQEILRRLPRP